MSSASISYVLVVDDTAFMRRVLIRILNGMGLDALEAADGESAMKTIKKDPPGMVILDLSMPRMSGTELCKWIRSNPDTAEIPIIICTAHKERKMLELAIKAGATDILCKPVTKANFESHVRKHLPVST